MGSRARAPQRRRVFTRLPRQPTMGVSKAVASKVSSGAQSGRFLAGRGLHMAAKGNLIGGFAAGKFPGIAVFQPVFRQFHLPAILDELAEQAVIIADAIAVSRDVEAGHAFHETGGQAAKATIAQGGVLFQRLGEIEIDLQFGQRGAEGFVEFKIAQRIAQQAADEKFE